MSYSRSAPILANEFNFDLATAHSSIESRGQIYWGEPDGRQRSETVTEATGREQPEQKGRWTGSTAFFPEILSLEAVWTVAHVQINVPRQLDCCGSSFGSYWRDRVAAPYILPPYPALHDRGSTRPYMTTTSMYS